MPCHNSSSFPNNLTPFYRWTISASPQRLPQHNWLPCTLPNFGTSPPQSASRLFRMSSSPFRAGTLTSNDVRSLMLLKLPTSTPSVSSTTPLQWHLVMVSPSPTSLSLINLLVTLFSLMLATQITQLPLLPFPRVNWQWRALPMTVILVAVTLTMLLSNTLPMNSKASSRSMLWATPKLSSVLPLKLNVSRRSSLPTLNPLFPSNLSSLMLMLLPSWPVRNSKASSLAFLTASLPLLSVLSLTLTSPLIKSTPLKSSVALLVSLPSRIVSNPSSPTAPSPPPSTRMRPLPAEPPSPAQCFLLSSVSVTLPSTTSPPIPLSSAGTPPKTPLARRRLPSKSSPAEMLSLPPKSSASPGQVLSTLRHHTQILARYLARSIHSLPKCTWRASMVHHCRRMDMLPSRFEHDWTLTACWASRVCTVRSWSRRRRHQWMWMPRRTARLLHQRRRRGLSRRSCHSLLVPHRWTRAFWNSIPNKKARCMLPISLSSRPRWVVR